MAADASAAATPSALGLPVPHRGGAWGTALVLGLAYALTMQRDLGIFDSAELSMVAFEGGLGHPTGQPLHTLLGWLAARLPGLPPLVALNLLSSVPAALCAIPIASLAMPSSASAPPRPGFVAAVTLLFGWHATLWEPATRVEVYALAAFFSLYALARLRAGGDHRHLFSAGLALGLAASVNPFMAVAGTLAGAGWLWQNAVQGQGRERVAALIRLAAGGLTGLLPYLHVLAVADRTDVFVWEGDDLLRYFSGADYAHNRGLGALEVATRALAWSGETLVNGQAVLWGAGLAAAGFAWRSHLVPLLVTLCGTVYVLSINRIFLVDNPDYLGYLLVPGGLATAAVAHLGHLRARLAGVLVAGVVVAVVASTPAPWARDRSSDRVARTVAEGILSEVPPDGIVLVGSDHLAFPLLYLQRVEVRRRDVVLLVDGLLDSSWYWRLTYAWHPELDPISLPGPHADRVRRFLDAHPSRSVHVESGALAGMVGRRMCAGAFLLQTTCSPDQPARIDLATRTLGRLSEETAWGAPHAANALAAIGWHRGEALWRLGHGDQALEALLASVPPALRPTATGAPMSAPPLRGPAPTFSTPVILGHPARNLFFGARLLMEAGRLDAAADALARAAALGLPEAMP